MTGAGKGRPLFRVYRGEHRSSAQLSPMDRGFLLGDALFETVSVHHGTPFRLASHLARMRASATRFSIPVPAQLEVAIAEMLAEHADECGSSARLRVTLSRGASRRPGLGMSNAADASLVIALMPVAVDASAPDAGISAVFAESRRNEQSASAGHKTTGFLDAIMELERAVALGADDAIFLDTSGHVSEATTSNVFLYDGSALVTPTRTCGALPGITRGVIRELADGLGIRFEERVVEREELLIARELFCTSAVRGIAPVLRIADWAAPGGGAGEVTRVLNTAYRELIHRECAGPAA